MGKISKEYLKIDEWKIIEEGFHKDRDLVSESLFSLGNEYCGVRGFFDEDYSGNKLIGTYYNGIYEYGSEIPTAYKGIAKRTHFTINSTNWLKCSFEVDGEILDLNKSKFDSFYRELDFRNGLYKRWFIWKVNGYEIHFLFERIISMTKCHEAASRITISANKRVKIRAKFYLDGTILHWRDKRYYIPKYAFNDEGVYTLQLETLSTKQTITTSMKLLGLDNEKYEYNDGLITVSSTLNIEKKETQITRLVVNIANKNFEDFKLTRKTSLLELKDLIHSGFEGIFKANTKYFDKVFSKNDIKIDGDKKNQQGIRYCIFQLEQTYHGYEKDNNIGAKGLTGEAYSGHAFWDSETYCLPYYLFSNKKAARDLLLFRYHTLAEAKKRAKDLDCDGACYPVATRNGEEACTLWQHASCQFQPSTGVSYAIYHYMNIYHDDEFMNRYGLEMLIEISKFLLGRGEYSSDNRHFGFYGVMGPDEFQLMVNHNTYTNFMAKKTFDYLMLLKKENAYDFSRVEKKCEINSNFYKNLKLASNKMLILYDPKTKLFEQHDGFYKLPHLDINKIPNSDFPLYSHWSYDRIYRNDMIKQPDVLMFMLLYNTDFSLDQIKANYEFYEPKCIHESSLSPSVHSILAAQIGKEKEAYNFFEFATRLDLDDYNNNTNEGIHMTSIAAAWMNIVYGFLGLRSDGKYLTFNPYIPKKWKSYSLNLNVPTGSISFKISKNDIKITNTGEVIKIKIYKKLYLVKKELVVKYEGIN